MPPTSNHIGNPPEVAITISREQLRRWTGRTLTDNDVEYLGNSVEQSTIPEELAAMAAALVREQQALMQDGSPPQTGSGRAGPRRVTASADPHAPTSTPSAARQRRRNAMLTYLSLSSQERLAAHSNAAQRELDAVIDRAAILIAGAFRLARDHRRGAHALVLMSWHDELPNRLARIEDRKGMAQWTESSNGDVPDRLQHLLAKCRDAFALDPEAFDLKASAANEQTLRIELPKYATLAAHEIQPGHLIVVGGDTCVLVAEQIIDDDQRVQITIYDGDEPRQTPTLVYELFDDITVSTASWPGDPFPTVD